MLSFPASTVFHKRIPKQKFYQELKASSSLEQLFVKEIDTIYWKNKLSPETLNVSASAKVTEIEVFEIQLKQHQISTVILESIDRNIPYHLVFVLRYKDLGQIRMSYKEQSKNSDKLKVDSYYQTPWMAYEELNLTLDGLSIDTIYDNFLLQVSGGKLQLGNDVDMKQAVANAKDRDKILARIQQLEKKIKNEKQFNQQVKLMQELRAAKLLLE